MTDPLDDVDLEAYRLRARDWLAANAPQTGWAGPGGWATDETWTEARHFQAAQYAAGFSGITWPTAFGGRGLSPAFQSVFNEEAASYTLPSSAFQITLSNIAPALLERGTEKQKRRYLPEMLRGDGLWVQLLSEPGAGSDLAGVRMRADRDGDEWVLNGEKVWSSYAQWSDYGMVLTRTNWDVPKHAGLTMFIMPLKAPGVTIRPLRQISGNNEFCQEFLEDVRLGDEAIVGKLDGGWSVVLSLLKHSREMTAGTASGGPVFDPARGGEADPGRDLIDFVLRAGLAGDHEVRRLVAELVTDNVVAGLLAGRVARLEGTSRSSPANGTMAKLFGAVTVQRRYEIELQVRGESTMLWRPDDEDGSKSLDDYLWGRTATIAGGTHEISANTIGEQLLRLPKEPAADRGLPFREVVRDRGLNEP